MSASNGKPTPTENQQLIGFIKDHLETYTAIEEATGYTATHLSNIHNGVKETPRTGFTLMLRQLAANVMIDAAKAGTLVKKELPLKAVSKPRGLTAAEVRNLIREEMNGRQAA